jgi:homotetrameric cytidine deaminase
MNWQELNSRASVPYSKTPRSCLVKSKAGNYYPGVRIENVSFPITINAIQAALFICLSEGDQPTSLILPDEDFSQLDFWVKEFGLEVQISKEPGVKPTDCIRAGKVNEKVRLKELLDQAITIHSDFPVSSILYTPEGYFEGVNIEVSDWGSGLCAERVAIAKAVAYGASGFSELAIHTRDGEFSSPCGSCRQVIIEHLPLNKVRLYHSDGSVSEHFSADFLPYSFSSASLRK